MNYAMAPFSPLFPGQTYNPIISSITPFLISGGSNIIVTGKDTTVNVITSATVGTQWNIINFSNYNQNLVPVLTDFISSNTGISTVDSVGNIYYINTGSCNISYNCRSSLNGSILLYDNQNIVNNTGISITTNFLSHDDTGSLVIHCYNQVNSLMNENPNSQQPVYSTYIIGTGISNSTIIRNVNNLLISGNLLSPLVDSTCIPVWNSQASSSTSPLAFCRCLISPSHLLTAQHVDGLGVTFWFMDNSGNISSRKATNAQNLANTDLEILTLDSPVPSGITPAYIMPSNAGNYLPCLYSGYSGLNPTSFSGNYVPAVYISQFNKICIGYAVYDNQSIWGIQGTTYGINGGLVPGDSSNPIFLIINRKLVILGVNYYALYEPSVQYNQNWISGAIKDNGSETLSIMSMSGFKFYP